MAKEQDPPSAPAGSPYALHCAHYLERGIPVIPTIPSEKRPGMYMDGRWTGMSNWSQFCSRLPLPAEVDAWCEWPGAGICLPMGPESGLVALDFDLTGPVLRALEDVLPRSPVRKKGHKGYTAFYRYNGEQSASWNVHGGERALDLLADGKQSVMPPSMHPLAITYHWITEDTLENFDVSDLPSLPDNLQDIIRAGLAPFMTGEDVAQSGARRATLENHEAGEAAIYFRKVKDIALDNLDLWVPKLLPGAKPKSDGSYRAIAHWRNCENPNVGIHPTGIMDFGGSIPMTAIDLVMRAQGWDFLDALDWLKDKLSTVLPRDETQPPLKVVSIKDAPVLDPDMPDVELEEVIPPPPDQLLHPPGMIGMVTDWINATSPKPQPALAVQAALALGSVLGGRIYRTDFANYTPLYFVNVAKSAAGKEHGRQAIERLLEAADLGHLISGGGYSSAGAVFSQLLDRPCHIALVDEFGKMLESAAAFGQQHKKDAITQLVQAFGCCHGTMRPPAYSTMTASNQQRQQMADRKILSPALTMLGMTTPDTFYDSLTSVAVSDGFLNRLLVVESHIGRQARQRVTCHEIPPALVEWCQEVRTRWTDGNLAGAELGPDVRPEARVVPFSPGAKRVFDAFERSTLALMDELEADRLQDLPGRSVEIAMRIALVLALGTGRWDSLTVEEREAEWAVAYVRYYSMQLVRSAKDRITNSEDEKKLKEVLVAISQPRRYVNDSQFRAPLFAGLMPRAKLCKLMKMKVRDLNFYIDTLVAMELVEEVAFSHAGQRTVRCLRLIGK